MQVSFKIFELLSIYQDFPHHIVQSDKAKLRGCQFELVDWASFVTDSVNWLQMRNLKNRKTGGFKKTFSTVFFSESIICQQSNLRNTARTVFIKGIIWGATKIKSLRDTANTKTIDRILNATGTNILEELHWHKSCHAKYRVK